MPLLEEPVSMEPVPAASTFVLQKESSIASIPKAEWDMLFQNKGAYSWDQLAYLEKVFGQNEKPEHHWTFHYFILTLNCYYNHYYHYFLNYFHLNYF